MKNTAFSPSLHNDCREVIKTFHPDRQAMRLFEMRVIGWYNLSFVEKQELAIISERASIRFAI